MNTQYPSSNNAFLAQFDPSIRTHIIEFGKRLSNIDTDIFITMPRKATCLINGLESLNLTALRAPVTSDRISDMNLDWVKGKRITLVDDVVVFGSTLAAARENFLNAGASDVQAVVLCVSNERWDRAKIQPQAPYLSLPHNQVVSVCASIVDAISVLPMPYAVDFPLFSKIRVPKDALQSLFGIPAWRARDVSSPRQREYGVHSITCTPPPELISELENRLGWNCAPISLAKIRLYVKPHMEGNPFLQCSALPLVVFQSMNKVELDHLWSLLETNSGCAGDSAWSCFKSPTSKLRLLQYLAASVLAQIWLEGVSRKLPDKPILGNSRFILDSVFSPPSIGLVQQLIESNNRMLQGAPRFEPASDPPDLELLSDIFNGNSNMAAVRARLSKPFVELERTSERKAQSSGRSVSPEEWSKLKAAEPFNRLDRGFTYQQLLDHMTFLGNDASEVVSLFLDQAIDRGIAVPITTFRNDAVFRAYRHGEDVLFSESEIRLFGLALKACALASNRSVLPHMLCEKLLVLMIRIGIQQRFLHPFLGVSGSPGTIGIRFSLHGAVAQAEVAEMYGHDDRNWVSSLLQQYGVLREVQIPGGRGSGLEVLSPVEASVYSGAENKAEQVGRLIGYLHQHRATESNSKSLVSLDELILIATCTNDTDVVGALAAEMDIFCSGWHRVRNKALGWSTTIPPESIEATNDKISWLTRQRIYTALNSAKWKFEQHAAGAPRQLVYYDIPNRLPDPIYQSVWRSFWPEDVATTKDYAESPEDGSDTSIKGLLELQMSWVYRTNIYYRLITLATHYIGSTSTAIEPELRTRVDSQAVITDLWAIAKAFGEHAPIIILQLLATFIWPISELKMALWFLRNF